MIDFSTLIGAVKPRERTDQYHVLSALYLLNAHAAPVTVRQVVELLELHLGAKKPKNVSACLRKYRAYVSPKEKGPPLRWLLTDAGLEHLNSLSGLKLPVMESGTTFSSDVGIVCALEHPELTAVMNASGGPGNWKEVGDTRHTHLYRESVLKTSDDEVLRLIATTSTSMGLTAAAIATTHLINLFRPRLILMIGIAAGTRSGGKEFGDVLIADPSVDYNSGKVVQSDGIREFQPDPYPIGLNPRLRSVLQKYRRPNDVFRVIRKKWKGPVPAGNNRVHLGPVGAADQVIDDATRVFEIQKNWRKLIGVEMETYGVYRAVHESSEPKPRVVSFKAVCDFAAEKSDSWQDFAAFTAAEFAVEFLKNEWSSLWPTI
jgi:nucleoside phosphorylase